MRKQTVFSIYSSENVPDFSFTVYEIIEENMKNLIRDLLLAIEFFIHFCGVNSSPMKEEGLSGSNSHIEPYTEDIWLDYNNRRYDVSVKISGNIHNPTRTPKSCRFADHTIPNYVPTFETKGARNFVKRAIFSLRDYQKYCVVYETEIGKVFGITIPPPLHLTLRRDYNGDPERLDPESFKYYIIYGGVAYEVWNHHGDPSSVYLVNLYPNNMKFNDQDKETYDIRHHTITFAGVTFSVWERNKIKVEEHFIPGKTIVAAQFPAISSPSHNQSG